MNQVIIGILATFRLSHLLMIERMPFDIGGKLRDVVGIEYDDRSHAYSDNELGTMFLCVWCMSIWAGWVVAFLLSPRRWFVRGLAYSAGAIWLWERIK